MGNQKSGCSCLPSLALIAALAIAGGYVYQKGWHQFLIGQKLTPLTGAKIIPDEAILTSYISTNWSDWQQLEKLGIENTPQIIKQATNEIQQELTDSNLNYQKDIQPWLDNAMVAIVSVDNNIKDSNILIVLGIKNPLNAYKFLKKINASQELSRNTINYQGKTITLLKDRQNQPLNFVLLGNKIVISDEILAVKQAIDTFQGEASFASDRKNQVALKQSFNLKHNLAQIYLTNYDRLVKNTFADSSRYSQQLALFQPVESIVLGIGTQDKQIKIQSFTKLNEQLKLPQYQPIKNQIADNFPQDTIALVNSQGIAQFWLTLVNLSEQDSEIKNLVNGMRTSTKWFTGLDLDRDIFSWMNQEFAIGIVPTEQAIIPDFNIKLGLALVLETSDRDTATNTLDSLENKLQHQLGVTSQTKQLKKQTVTQWLFPYTYISVSHSWLEQKYLLLTIGNNVFESMEKSITSSFKKNSEFQQFTRELPRNPISYFYLDAEQLMQQIQQIPGLTINYNSEIINILNSIQSIGSASVMKDSKTNQTDTILLFKQK